MTLEVIVLVILVFTTCYNLGVQAYIHFEAYPLIPLVGKKEFATYIQEYERRLAVPLLLPYLVTLVSNIVLFFAHPDGVEVVWIALAFGLNLAVSLVTLFVATPPYTRIKEKGEATAAEMSQLLQINVARLVLSLASSLVAIYVVADLLSK